MGLGDAVRLLVEWLAENAVQRPEPAKVRAGAPYSMTSSARANTRWWREPDEGAN
jgi:hypothetical protein